MRKTIAAAALMLAVAGPVLGQSVPDTDVEVELKLLLRSNNMELDHPQPKAEPGWQIHTLTVRDWLENLDVRVDYLAGMADGPCFEATPQFTPLEITWALLKEASLRANIPIGLEAYLDSDVQMMINMECEKPHPEDRG